MKTPKSVIGHLSGTPCIQWFGAGYCRRVAYAAVVDLESVDEVLRTTRSVRRRLDFERPIPPEVLEECIEIATQAPTGRNAENWRFLIVTDVEKKAAIGDLYRRALARLVDSRRLEAKTTQQALADRMHEMPALILVCAIGRPSAEISGQVGFYGSILPAAWSLMLALRSRGLGTTWTSLHTLFAPEAAELLSIPDDVTQTVLLPVGYMKDAVLRPAKRRPPHEVTYWNAWEARRDESS
jgi:nitroreductase